jgi:hypothetical protein
LSNLFNVKAYRGRQYSGSPQSPDIVAMPEIHFEVKRTEAFKLYPSLMQATNDAGNSIPVVLHRRNRYIEEV